jgi:di/tricarboxylate transporter
MTLHQAEAFIVIAAMLALFMSGRLRFDLVAALALVAAVVLGVVPAAKAFSGFSNPVIIIIGSVLVVSRAIAASNVLDAWIGALLARVKSPSLQIGLLTASVGYLSAFIKNVGTLGIFMPMAIQAARRARRPRSDYLMPLAFGSLVGGTITKIGTSPNLLISSVREDLGRGPFGLFDFAPVGLPLTTLALLFLSVGWRLLPQREGQRTAEEQFSIESYSSELHVPRDLQKIDLTVGELEAMADGEVSVAAILREGSRRYIPAEDWHVYAGDVLIVIGDAVAVGKVVARSGFGVGGTGGLKERPEAADEMQVVEVLVPPESPLVGATPASVNLRHRYGLNLVSVRRASQAAIARLRSHRFAAGDIVLLQGWGQNLAKTFTELSVLPLADRGLALGRQVSGLVPLGLLAVALLAVGLRLVDVEVAFFAAAVLTVLTGQLTAKEAYASIEMPVIVMLGCLIPVGEGLRETGASGLLADALTRATHALPGAFALGLVMALAMLLTPLLHHAAAVLVLGPVAAAVAANLGDRPEPFLMAVALGCACDFLTPIGHQNNTLVMGPAGYRFGDYWRLGLPLTVMVLAVGTPLILHTWPLR